MSMNLDKPLEDIIKSQPRKPRGGRGAGRGRGSGARKSSGTGGAKAAVLGRNAQGASAANKNRAPLIIPGRYPGGKDPGSKIIVGNLPTDVTEAQVKDLFASSVGPLRRVAMSYRANGSSTGQCTVEFQRAADGDKAYQQYNNRLIDGKKAIRIEVVVDPARAAAVAVQQQAATAAIGSPAAAAGKRTRTRGAAGRGGARGGRRGGGAASAGGRTKQPKKSLEDLDAEMEDYATKGTAA